MPSVVGMKKVVRTVSAVKRWMSMVGTAKMLERMTVVGMIKAVGMISRVGTVSAVKVPEMM